MLCNILLNGQTGAPIFFSCVRTRRLLSRHTCPVLSPKFILGDPGAVSRVDKMFVVNFHHEHFIDPTNCPWVSEDDQGWVCKGNLGFSYFAPTRNGGTTDDFGRRFRCYQQDRSNLLLDHSVTRYRK